MDLQRRGGRCYLYRSAWRDGRSVREYVASGEIAELLALDAALARARRSGRRRDELALRESLDAEERDIIEYCRDVDSIVATALRSAGYHRPGRHGWRRRRPAARACAGGPGHPG